MARCDFSGCRIKEEEKNKKKRGEKEYVDARALSASLLG